VLKAWKATQPIEVVTTMCSQPDCMPPLSSHLTSLRRGIMLNFGPPGRNSNSVALDMMSFSPDLSLNSGGWSNCFHGGLRTDERLTKLPQEGDAEYVRRSVL